MLMAKLKRASRETGISQIAIAGGVSANSGLRKALDVASEKLRWRVFVPDFQYCTDNAGMIAMAAHFKYLESDFCGLDASPSARYAI